MKKLILITGIAILALTSCKKDRTCHCKTTTDFYDASGTKISTSISETDNVMTKAKRSTAFNNCIHSKSSNSYTGGRTDVDDYCEIKK